jgi:hypothetical protein
MKALDVLDNTILLMSFPPPINQMADATTITNIINTCKQIKYVRSVFVVPLK